MQRYDGVEDRYLLDEQLLAHGDALVEPLLVFLQESLLLINLSPQVAVGLERSDGEQVNAAGGGNHAKWCCCRSSVGP